MFFFEIFRPLVVLQFSFEFLFKAHMHTHHMVPIGQYFHECVCPPQDRRRNLIEIGRRGAHLMTAFSGKGTAETIFIQLGTLMQEQGCSGAWKTIFSVD